MGRRLTGQPRAQNHGAPRSESRDPNARWPGLGSERSGEADSGRTEWRKRERRREWAAWSGSWRGRGGGAAPGVAVRAWDGEGRSATRARFLGREEGPSARAKGTHWEHRGQRREEAPAAAAEAGGRAAMQGPQREWPQGRTRGTAEAASNGERHTGHSGGSASASTGGAVVAMIVVSANRRGWGQPRSGRRGWMGGVNCSALRGGDLAEETARPEYTVASIAVLTAAAASG